MSNEEIRHLTESLEEATDNLFGEYQRAMEDWSENSDNAIFEAIIRNGFGCCNGNSDGDVWRGFVLGYVTALDAREG